MQEHNGEARLHIKSRSKWQSCQNFELDISPGGQGRDICLLMSLTTPGYADGEDSNLWAG